MTASREVLELECKVRFIEIAVQQEPTDTPIDLFVDGFWEGVRALSKPRSAEALRARLEVLATMRPAKKPRRRPNF